MSKIVESYIKLDDMFKKCHSDYDLSLDDLRTYRILLDDFVKAAREKYSNEDLDVSSSLKLFFSDSVAQEELKQHMAAIGDEGKKKHV